ncbi:hypothetical protein M9458_034219, partial [Cirrhinus mrigala]
LLEVRMQCELNEVDRHRPFPPQEPHPALRAACLSPTPPPAATTHLTACEI